VHSPFVHQLETTRVVLEPSPFPSWMASSCLQDILDCVLRCPVPNPSLDDIFDAVGAAGLEGAEQEHDLQHDQASHRVKYSALAKAHCRAMRAEKRCKKSDGRNIVSANTQSRIDNANESWAIRPNQLVGSPSASSRSQRISGIGKWRHWLPSAIQRCCFGALVLPRPA
jgi:hypothetical protein